MLQLDLIRVTNVRYIRDYVLWLTFSDGAELELPARRTAAKGN